MQVFTLLGQPPITVGILIFIYGYGVYSNEPMYISYGIFGIAAVGIATTLKLVIHRARPLNNYVKKMLIPTYSFPSGHAAGSIASYVTVAIIIYQEHVLAGSVSILIAIILSFCIGVSRIYLGAHYASDVVGGWLVGTLGILTALLYVY
jgi:undecaprenyl-diphosphatase